MTATVQLLGPISNSNLEILKRCAKRYWYRYHEKLVPKEPPKNMAKGTLYHQGAAAGYNALRGLEKATVETRTDRWLRAALTEMRRPDPRDRDGLPLGLSQDDVDACCDMALYYWQNQGCNDEFDEILGVEEEVYFEIAGWRMRGTIDLRVRIGGLMEIWDHKTSSDINQDQTHLPIDLQTHDYYYAAYKTWGEVALRFCHNWQRQFDFAGKQRVGPPSWQRPDGTWPYLKTESGRIATRTSDPNEYVRRVHTPVGLDQILAFEKELTDRLTVLRFHELTGVWPRSDQKGPLGCGGCDYFSLCSSESSGREVAPAMIDMLFTRL